MRFILGDTYEMMYPNKQKGKIEAAKPPEPLKPATEAKSQKKPPKEQKPKQEKSDTTDQKKPPKEQKPKQEKK